MKKYLFTILLINSTLITFSQGVGINDDGSMPADGAILDVKSTTQGMLIPRMTEAQRDAISPDTQSMLIYQTNNDSGFYYYDGSVWTPFLSGGAAANSGWRTKGNSGTTAGTNFIGTIDSVDWVIKTDDTEQIRVKANGNVGIGSSAPEALVAVGTNNTPQSASTSTILRTAVELNSTGDSWVDLYGTANGGNKWTILNNNNTGDPGELAFQNANSSKMVLLPNGNVGIGTTTPGTLLDVQKPIAAGAGAGTAAITAYNSNYSQVVVPADVRAGIATVGHWDNSVAPGSFHGTGFYSKVPSGGHLSHTSAAIFEREELSSPNLRRVYMMGSDTGFRYTTAVFPYILAVDKSNEEVDFIVQGDGNVGVGTESPTSELEISGDDPILIVRNTNEATNETAMLSFNTGTNGTAFSDLNRIGSIRAIVKGTSPLLGALEFRVNRGDNTDPMMYIQEDGNVGIGSITPNAKLAVETATAGSLLLTLADENSNASSKSGNISVNHYTNTEEPILLIGGTSSATNNTVVVGGNVAAANAATDIRFYTAANQTTVTGSERMRIISSGNVGIGETNPTTKLEVNGANGDQFTLDNDGSQWTQANFFNNGTQRAFMAYDNTNHILAIGGFSSNASFDRIGFRASGGTDHMVVKRDGNVGIGTTAPFARLQVLRNDNTTSVTGYSGAISVKNESTTAGHMNTVNFRGRTTGGSAYSTGIIGMVQTPAAAVVSADMIMGTTTTAGNLTEKMRITSAGNVGIGTAAPTEKLDVNGTARIRSIGSAAGSPLYYVAGTGVLSTSASDKRLKKNIKSMNNTLEKVMQLRSVTYNWKSNPNSITKDFGFIAQEVESIFPEVVFTNPTDGYMGINYDRFISVLTKALQQQQQIIESQSKKLDHQEIINQELKTEIEEIKNILNQTGRK